MDERRFDWDPAKSARNAAERGLPFETARDFDFEAAIVFEDDRYDYGETRLTAVGPIGLRLHVLVHTMRGDTIWVISLRKANRRETRRYDREIHHER